MIKHLTPYHPRPGESNGKAVLTADQVITIRKEVAAGEPQNKVALRYGVKPAAINKIVTFRTWKSVPIDKGQEIT